MACDDRPVCIFAFYLQIRGGGIFILYPALNVQLTPVVIANRHFHVTVPRSPCGSIRNIGFGGRDIHIVLCFERAAHPRGNCQQAFSCYRVFPAMLSKTFDWHVLFLRMMRIKSRHELMLLC